MIGYACDTGQAPYPSVEEFDGDTMMLLAQAEHLRWVYERISRGWTYAPVRDNEKKHHPLLVPWEDLPPEEQRKDYNAVENIIPLLHSVGIRVYRPI